MTTSNTLKQLALRCSEYNPDMNIPDFAKFQTLNDFYKAILLQDAQTADEDVMTLPPIKDIDDIINHKMKIVQYCLLNPTEDMVYKLIPNEEYDLPVWKKGDNPTNFISGSTALKEFIQLMTHKTPSWKPNDVDCFNIQSKCHFRYSFGNVDQIYVTHPTIEEMLLAFDIPVDRVAKGGEGWTWYVSLQCLYAILTGEYLHPTYMVDRVKLNDALENESDEDTKADIARAVGLNWYTHQERIAKYKTRGFQPDLYDCDTILPYAQGRFSYIHEEQMTKKKMDEELSRKLSQEETKEPEVEENDDEDDDDVTEQKQYQARNQPKEWNKSDDSDDNKDQKVTAKEIPKINKRRRNNDEENESSSDSSSDSQNHHADIDEPRRFQTSKKYRSKKWNPVKTYAPFDF